MRHHIRRNLVEPFLTGNQVVFAGKLPLQLLFLFRIKLSLFEQSSMSALECIRQLQFGDAVLVVQRNRRLIINRLLEIVDADVIAEDLLRPFR